MALANATVPKSSFCPSDCIGTTAAIFRRLSAISNSEFDDTGILPDSIFCRSCKAIGSYNNARQAFGFVIRSTDTAVPY